MMPLRRLIVVVEGHTEEAFVKDVLQPHLNDSGVYTSATLVGKTIAQKRGHRRRGGGHFKHWRKDIKRILGGERGDDLRVTTLFDLYGLPDDFPGLGLHGADADTLRRCASLEAALADDIHDHRFIPYIQRHEFETLVLAALPSLAELLDAEDDLAGLAALKEALGPVAPEDVNDGRNTAPSKRLLDFIPGFSKVLHGPLAIADTGLASLRRQCPRFGVWVRKLEKLSAAVEVPKD